MATCFIRYVLAVLPLLPHSMPASIRRTVNTCGCGYGRHPLLLDDLWSHFITVRHGNLLCPVDKTLQLPFLTVSDALWSLLIAAH